MDITTILLIGILLACCVVPMLLMGRGEKGRGPSTK